MWIPSLVAAVLAFSGAPFHAPESSPTVAELCRVGRDELNRRGFENLTRARESFLNAIALDDDSALAHAGLAEAYALLGDYPRAEASASRALELDPALARGHATLAFVRLHAHWDWARAESGFRRALQLDPADAAAHHWYAIYLETMGRNEEAVVEARRALELEPAVQAYALGVAYRLFWARRYDDAIVQLERVLERDRSATSAHYFQGRALTELGRLKKAKAALRAARRLAPRDLNVSAALGYLQARSGQRAEAAERLEELRSFTARGYPLSTHIASLHAALGDRESALAWLERAHREHEGPLLWLKVDPRFDVLRSEPRLRALLARMKLDAETPGPTPSEEHSTSRSEVAASALGG